MLPTNEVKAMLLQQIGQRLKSISELQVDVHMAVLVLDILSFWILDRLCLQTTWHSSHLQNSPDTGRDMQKDWQICSAEALVHVQINVALHNAKTYWHRNIHGLAENMKMILSGTKLLQPKCETHTVNMWNRGLWRWVSRALWRWVSQAKAVHGRASIKPRTHSCCSRCTTS